MNTNTTISTKVNKDATAVETQLTIVWDGMSDDDIRALAQQALVVKLQSNLRASGTIPTELSVNALDYRVGVRAPRKSPDIFALVGTLSDEQKAALLAQLTA